MAHYQVQQRMRAIANAAAVQALRKAVLDLLHLAFQALARQFFQLKGQGQIRQCCQ